MYALLSAALLALPILASPTTSPMQWGCPKGQVKYTKNVNANFDDLSGLPLIPALNKINTYKGLFYQAFVLSQTLTTNVLPGVVPNSGKNYAATGVLSETTAGTPTLTVNYQNSNVKEFTPQSFAYGCVVQLENSATALPAQCIATFTGYKGPDNTANAANQVCSKTFQFLPSTDTGSQQMATGTFPASCKGITHGTFTFTRVGGGAATNPLLAFLLDTVKYSYSGCKKA